MIETTRAGAEDGERSGEPVHRVLYICLAREPFTRSALAALLAKSRANNERNSVTGILLYKGGLFLQLLEGPRPAVRRLFERISSDARHCGCTMIDESSSAERTFPDWRMAFRNLDDPEIAAMPGFSDFMNQVDATAAGSRRDPTHYWRLLDYFRREM